MSIRTEEYSFNNKIIYKHYCTTMNDLYNIPEIQITLGSIAYINNEKIFIANSNHTWNIIDETNAKTINDDSVYICKEGEYDNNFMPTIEDPSTEIIYLVPTNNETNHQYNEYKWVDNNWILIGIRTINTTVNINIPIGGTAGQKLTKINNEDYNIEWANESDPTISNWAKAETKPSYTAMEVGALPNSTFIPTKTSDLINDSNFITDSQLPSMTDYYNKTEINNFIQDIENDINKAEPEVTKKEFTVLEKYVRDMAPLKTVGPVGVASVSDAAPLSAEQVVVDIEPLQAGSGDPSPTNVRPITGWTGAKVTRTGKAVWGGLTMAEAFAGTYRYSLDTTAKTFTFTHGNQNVQGVWKMDLFNCPDGIDRLTYLVTYSNSGANRSIVFDYSDGTRSLLELLSTSGEKATLFGQTQAGKTLVRIHLDFFADALTTVYYDETAFVPGDVAREDMEPYVGDTCDIAFPSSAGTVYGGTLTIDADGGGELVVTEFGHVFDGTETMISPIRSDLAIISFPGMVFRGWIYASAKRSSSHFGEPNKYGWDGVGANQWLAAGGNYWGFGGYTPTEFKSYAAAQYANGTPITCYTSLSTPVAYTFTAEQITMLRGVNNVWADCGDTTLAYRQDVVTLLSHIATYTDSDGELIVSVTSQA